MLKLRKFSLLLAFLLCSGGVGAQYYSWGGDAANVRWKRLKTQDVKLIYPDYFEENARRMMWYMDTIRPYVAFGYRHGTMPTPVIMRTRNMSGNGMVMWAPKRIEMLSSPASTYSEPWLKQLVIHEYRHNVQFNNLRRSTARVLTWILGDQAAWIGNGQYSLAIIEGDAVMAETEMSAFGRGLQPSWTMHYRAVGDVSMGRVRADPQGEGRSDSLLRRSRREQNGRRRYTSDYWFSGSYRHYVPDHYQLGYQMVRWSYDHYGKFIWDDVAHYVARNPQWILPMIPAMKKLYDTGTTKMFRQTFEALNGHWDSLPLPDEDSAVRLVTPETSYTTYRWPMWMNDSTLVAFKTDFDRYGRIVKVDLGGAGGKMSVSARRKSRRTDTLRVRPTKEKVLAHIGRVSSRPVMDDDGVIWWTEFRSSLLWQEQVSSRLCSYDPASGVKKVWPGGKRQGNRELTPEYLGPEGNAKGSFGRRHGELFMPTPTPGGMAFVSFDYTGRHSIVRRGDPLQPRGVMETLVRLPMGVEVTGLAWDDFTERLYFIGLDDRGMFLGMIEAAGYKEISSARHISISDLRAGGGKLYFGSIVSGRDEAHMLDLASGKEYRLTTSRFGAFQPMPAMRPGHGTGFEGGGGHKSGMESTGGSDVSRDDGAERKIAVTVYDKNGYHLAVQDAADAVEQEFRALPLDVVNPPWKRWSLPKMDSIVYSPAAEKRSRAEVKSKRYRKGLTLFKPHSWLPINFYPPGAIQEADLTIGLGATVMSQNLLSDAVSWLAYGWSRRGSHLLRGGMEYSGLGPVLSVDFNWGGAAQQLYQPVGGMMLGRYNAVPSGLDLRLKRYFSVSAGASMPMTVSSGYWAGTVTPGVRYFYTNGLIIRPNADGTTATLVRGVERMTFSASYSGQTRMAHKDFLPKWGFGARLSYVLNPTNRSYRDLWSASLSGYLPGVVRPHSVRLRLGWQQVSGSANYRTKSGETKPRDLMFHMKELFPRGAVYNFATRRWGFASIDYQLPVWYPEGGIPRFLYFKRVRLNLFADYARWQDFSGPGTGLDDGGRWSPLFTYGGDIILDISPLRMPGTTTVSVKFTVAKPSDRRGVWFNFGLDIPL